VGDFEFGVYETKVGNFVSLLSTDHVFRHGLPREAIVEQIAGPMSRGAELTPENFAANPAFRDFLHNFIATNAPLDPDMQTAVREQGEGFIYVIDQRTPTPEDEVPPGDIVGRFAINGGQLKPDSYEPSPAHRLLSDRGFFRLGAQLEQRLLEELERLPSA
jgi:hypothetical protein